MEQVTNAWEMVNDAINFGTERYIREGTALIHRINVFLHIDERAEAAEIEARKHRTNDTIMLYILDRTVAPAALDFYERNDATKRLINAGIISRKTRGGWKINRKLDPR